METRNALIPVLALAVLSLAACAEVPVLEGPAPVTRAYGDAGDVFRAEAFSWSLGGGPGALQGVMGYRNGAVRYSCQGGDVVLTPETAWSRRRMVILYGSATAAAVPVSIVRARTPSAPTGDYARFVRHAACGADNHFAFGNLPDGAWYVITVAKSPDGQGEPIAVSRRVETHGASTSLTLN